MTAYELSKYIITGVLLLLIGYLWLIVVSVQGPAGA